MPRPSYPIPYEADISLPTIAVDNPTMVNLITHLATHNISVVGASPGIPAHLSLAWYGLSDAQWESFLAVVPQFTYAKRDVHGLKHLLHALNKDALQSRATKTIVGETLLRALPGSDVLMKTYNPESQQDTLQYDDFLIYIRTMEQCMTFQEWKVVTGIKLLQAYEGFKTITATLTQVCL